MKEFKGTPGKFTHDVIESGSGEVFVSVLNADGVSIAFCGKDKIAEANAQLFSAAPDLLEALQNMIGAFDNPIVRRKLPSDFNSEAIQSARTAITKALGETK